MYFGLFHWQKETIVIPIIKKKNLDCNTLTTGQYLTVLLFISKVLVRVVLSQLQNHLQVVVQSNNVVEIHQSAYGKDHLTTDETNGQFSHESEY